MVPIWLYSPATSERTPPLSSCGVLRSSNRRATQMIWMRSSARQKKELVPPDTKLRLALGQNEISTLVASAVEVSSAVLDKAVRHSLGQMTVDPVWFLTESMAAVALITPDFAWGRRVFPIPNGSLTHLQSAGTAVATQRQRQRRKTTDALLQLFELRRHLNYQSQRHVLQPTRQKCSSAAPRCMVLEQERGNGQSEQICCRWN